MSDNYEVSWSDRPAVAAPPDLHARYETDRPGAYVTTPIYAFSVQGIHWCSIPVTTGWCGRKCWPRSR